MVMGQGSSLAMTGLNTTAANLFRKWLKWNTHLTTQRVT